MTRNDRLLIEEAYATSYREWENIYTLIPDADEESTKKRLKNIGELLRDVYYNGYRI